jgi:hypothetical protein
VSVALVMPHAMHMRRIILSGSTIFFYITSKNAKTFGGGGEGRGELLTIMCLLTFFSASGKKYVKSQTGHG